MRRILFIDNAIENDTYQALDYWRPLLVYPFDVFRVALGEWPSDPDMYSHILITGSTACVLDNSDWMQTEIQLIQSAVKNGKVMLGSCFGHQIIALSIFGAQSVRKRPVPEIGWPDIEILADDPEKAADFYRQVFEWDISTWGGEQAYWLVTTGPDDEPGINGAIMHRHFDQAVVNTQEVESLADALERIDGAGGKVVQGPNEIPGVGTHAYCADPQGIIFGVLEPVQEEQD